MILISCIGKLYCRQISWVVDNAAGSTEPGVNVPKLDRRFKNNICGIAGLCFSCGLVFNVDEKSIALNTDYLVTRSPLQIPFSGLFVLEEDTISNLKGWVIS